MASDTATKPSGGIVALIPARAGSKGIPGKNLRPLAGRPLLAHAISSALDQPLINRVILTTDSGEMAAAGLAAGAEVPFLRPADLAADDTPMLAVLRHAVGFLQEGGWLPEIVVLLQPTAPFRRREDLAKALDLILAEPLADSVVSVEEVPGHHLPHIVMKVEEGRLVNFLPEGRRLTRRQDAPMAYTRNGQFYITRASTLMDKKSIYGDFSLPYITRHKAINLDTLDDWEQAEALAKSGGLPPR